MLYCISPCFLLVLRVFVRREKSLINSKNRFHTTIVSHLSYRPGPGPPRRSSTFWQQQKAILSSDWRAFSGYEPNSLVFELVPFAFPGERDKLSIVGIYPAKVVTRSIKKESIDVKEGVTRSLILQVHVVLCPTTKRRQAVPREKNRIPHSPRQERT